MDLLIKKINFLDFMLAFEKKMIIKKLWVYFVSSEIWCILELILQLLHWPVKW